MIGPAHRQILSRPPSRRRSSFHILHPRKYNSNVVDFFLNFVCRSIFKCLKRVAHLNAALQPGDSVRPVQVPL